VPASVSAEVLMRAAAARPRRPDCCQPESSMATHEGPPGGPMKAKLRAGSKDRRGAQPPHTAGGNTTRGETAHHKGRTAHGETHPPTVTVAAPPGPRPFGRYRVGCPHGFSPYPLPPTPRTRTPYMAPPTPTQAPNPPHHPYPCWC